MEKTRRVLRSQAELTVADCSNSQVPMVIEGDGVDRSDLPIEDSDTDSEHVEECYRNEDELRLKQKVNSIECIEAMRISPKEQSRFNIPLCRMIPMPIVRPSLDIDIKKLETDFAIGYRPGSPVFYVSVCDEKGDVQILSADDKSRMTPLWQLESDRFDAQLQHNEHLHHLVGRMFFICDGNHRFKAWTGYIERLHKENPRWHVSVDSICLDPSGKTWLLLHAMHDINKFTENSHVKTNLVHTLHRIRAVGTQSMESFKDILPESEFQRCLRSPARGKTWYPLTKEVFISLLWQQEISDAADEAAQKILEEDPGLQKTDQEITDAMLAAAKLKTHSYKGQFGKLLAVTNPTLGDDFLAEITLHWSKNLKAEMTLDKLQLLATSMALASFKVKWLRWWNSGDFTRQAAHFPSKPFSDKEFESWLNKACFGACLEEALVLEVERMQKEEGLMVIEDSSNTVLSPTQFMEYWRVRVWVHGFPSLFRGKDSYSRTKPFVSYSFTSRIVKRVLYRYIMLELVPKGVVQRTQLPAFMTTWVDKTSVDQCMYSTGFIRSWGVLHLNSGCWYIDCGGGFCPVEEEEKMKAIDQAEKGLGSSDQPTNPIDQTIVQHDVAMDLSHMNDKEKVKALKNMQRTAERAEARKIRDLEKKAEKAAKANLVANVKAMAAEVVASIKATGKAPQNLQKIGALGGEGTQTSSASPSRGCHKRDSSCIDLTISRLSLENLPVLPANDFEFEKMDEFIFNGSLHSLLNHRVEHGSFPSGWLELQSFFEKHKADKERAFKGNISQSRGIDLLVLDLPEGLPVPGVSSPTSMIPPWNNMHKDFLKSVFDFASSHLHDDGAILLFHSDAHKVKLELRSFCRAYDFKVYWKRTGINRLYLANSRDPSKMTFIFGIQLLVKNLPNVPPSRFKVQLVPGLDAVDSGDVLHNVVTKESQLMHGNVPWRGPREKDPGLMQILIESFSLPGDVVFDCSAATGSSIHACRRSGRHIVAFEEDASIFNALLQPLIIEREGLVSKKQRVEAESSSSDHDSNLDSEVPEVHPTNLFCTSRVTTSAARNFILQPLWKKVASSPPNPFLLPVYAQDLAEAFVRAPPRTSRSRHFRGDPRILQLVDDAADCDNDIGNSHFVVDCE